MEDDRVWYLQGAEGPAGPYAAEEIRAWIAEGAVAADRPAWREGMETWRPAGEVPELSGSSTAGASDGAPIAGSPVPVPAALRAAASRPRGASLGSAGRGAWPTLGADAETDRRRVRKAIGALVFVLLLGASLSVFGLERTVRLFGLGERFGFDDLMSDLDDASHPAGSASVASPAAPPAEDPKVAQAKAEIGRIHGLLVGTEEPPIVVASTPVERAFAGYDVVEPVAPGRTLTANVGEAGRNIPLVGPWGEPYFYRSTDGKAWLLWTTRRGRIAVSLAGSRGSEEWKVAPER